MRIDQITGLLLGHLGSLVSGGLATTDEVMAAIQLVHQNRVRYEKMLRQVEDSDDDEDPEPTDPDQN